MFMGLFRYAAAGLMGLSVFASLAKHRKLSNNQSCINRNVCTVCVIYDKCALPKALSKKQAIKESTYAG